jgi:putative endonuclease
LSGAEKSWCVYILRCADESFYTGITNDLARRMSAHEEGKGAKYTAGRGPFLLVYQETCNDRSQASSREMEIKKLSREQKMSLIMASAYKV